MNKKILLLLVLVLPAFAQNRTTTRDSIIVSLAGSSAVDTVWVPFPQGNSVNPPAFMFNRATATIPGRTVDYVSGVNLWVAKTGTGTAYRIIKFPMNPLTGALSKNDSTYVVGSSGAAADITSGSDYALTTVAGTHGVGFILKKTDAGTAVLTLILELAR